MIPSVSITIPAYQGVLYTVFQQLRQNADHGLVVALTSANSGEGVTHSVGALVSGLSKDPLARTLTVDSRRLRTLTTPPSDLGELCQPIDHTVSEFVDRRSVQRDLAGTPMGPHTGPYSWEGSWQYRRDCVEQLRTNFDYVLIDCPSIKEAGDVLSLAPFVDGVIIVVQADKTRKDQILHAEKSIEFARGNLIGHILNKRTYLVPQWLYEKL
jgi:hypothetical protein